MSTARTFHTTIDGKTLTFETGKLAAQAGGAVTVRLNDTLLLAAATLSMTPREGIDFFPLTVDYEERLYAGGRIPGSFFRREGRPSEASILIDRLVDRPIRPLFPKDMHNDVQILLYTLSSDGETPVDVLAIVGASAALTISDVPFLGPVGGVRVGMVDGAFVINPSYQQLEVSPLDLRLAGTRDAILMVECGANEVSEQTVVEALAFGHRQMQPLIDLQEEMRAAVGKEKSSYPSFQLDEQVVGKVEKWVGDRLRRMVEQPLTRGEQTEAFLGLKIEATATLCQEGGLDSGPVDQAIDQLYKKEVRRRILVDGKRPDGRGFKDIRPLSAEVDLSPRAHGSGLFTRGETQVLTMATLGTPRERQELDGLSPIDEKRYMHHYNFPPFSTGEVRPLRGTSRRDTGHGALAERALVPVLPPLEEFPYTVRLVSEVLSSNGSTSMASVCGSTLALLDTGVPIRAPVAGIAMGLIKDDERYAVLTDIQGAEDHFGDMDFKVAGTRQGITALQMDIKIKGITAEIMSAALEQAREARLTILDVIEQVMPAPRPELKPFVPRLTIIKIDPDKIGAVIGPGGKMIRSIQEQTGVKIDIEDDGSVFIAAADAEKSNRARELIESLTEVPIVGRIYTGKVVRTTDFGAFIEILPNIDGMVHISQLDSERVEKVEDVARLGEELTVMVTSIDPEGKIRLSRQAVLEGWTPEEALERDRRTPRRTPDGGGSGSGRPSGRPTGSGRSGRGGSGPSRR
ncbi:MAG: polyribonucleotide nucleotidyltransferase [Anaerolineales bacterium]|nr:polyribonucleotide nucleotidyltransferase [Anaerolineales bacterium]